MAALFLLSVEEENESSLRRQRVLRDRLNPLEYLCDVEVIDRYRLPRQYLYELTDELKDHVFRLTNRSHSIPALIQVKQENFDSKHQIDQLKV